MRKVFLIVSFVLCLHSLFPRLSQAARTDCDHYCDMVCWDRIEQYEDSIGGCANGAPGGGPHAGHCEWASGPPNRPVLVRFGCENGAGCNISGKLNCGVGKTPAVPNIPQNQTGGIYCPEKFHNSGVLLPAVVVHHDSGSCQYMDGTFISWGCDSAGTGVDVLFGTN